MVRDRLGMASDIENTSNSTCIFNFEVLPLLETNDGIVSMHGLDTILTHPWMPKNGKVCLTRRRGGVSLRSFTQVKMS